MKISVIANNFLLPQSLYIGVFQLMLRVMHFNIYCAFCRDLLKTMCIIMAVCFTAEFADTGRCAFKCLYGQLAISWLIDI